MPELQNAINAFPEKWTLIIAGLMILFASLVIFAAIYMSKKGGE